MDAACLSETSKVIYQTIRCHQKVVIYIFTSVRASVSNHCIWKKASESDLSPSYLPTRDSVCTLSRDEWPVVSTYPPATVPQVDYCYKAVSIQISFIKGRRGVQCTFHQLYLGITKYRATWRNGSYQENVRSRDTQPLVQMFGHSMGVSSSCWSRAADSVHTDSKTNWRHTLKPRVEIVTLCGTW